MRRPCPDQAFHAVISFRQMKIAHGLDDLRADWRYPVVTIGNFDGVHVGHRRILTQTAEIAMRNSGTSVAMTFWPHSTTWIDATPASFVTSVSATA